MFQQDCAKCEEIFRLESNLDKIAIVLANKVKDFRASVREYNNSQWEQFAKLCQVWLLGDMVWKLRKQPFNLKDYPEHYNKPWYKEEMSLIQAEAHKLEQLKGSHLEHWGDEIVKPADSSDPAGYYTPDESPRSECYARGLTPFIPNKYDFCGGEEFSEEEMVMCSVTKKLVSIVDCDSVADQSGVRYTQRRFSSRISPFPGFNEWRDSSYYNNRPHPMGN